MNILPLNLQLYLRVKQIEIVVVDEIRRSVLEKFWKTKPIYKNSINDISMLKLSSNNWKTTGKPFEKFGKTIRKINLDVIS